MKRFWDEWRGSILVILGIVICILICFGFARYIKSTEKPIATYDLQLMELQTNVYAHIDNVVSKAPAYNYEMATFCAADGHVYTVKGDVNVVFTNAHPHAVWSRSKLINSDKVTLYVPQGSVVYDNDVYAW